MQNQGTDKSWMSMPEFSEVADSGWTGMWMQTGMGRTMDLSKGTVSPLSISASAPFEHYPQVYLCLSS